MEFLSDTKLNYSIHSDNVFIKNCSLCDIIFSVEEEYELHLKGHPRISKSLSQQCNKNIDKGIKLHFTNNNNMGTFQCIYCDIGFSRSVDLKRHTRIHKGSKIKYKCNLCDTAFTKMFHLNSHMRIHTKERPFQCSVCNKAFTQNCNLVKHMTIHTGERPFECSECGRAFSNRSVLSEHMKIHSGVKPFECSQCEKAFSKNSHLERHMMIHTGEKPYPCNQCQLSFNQKAHLFRHMLLAHNGEEDIQVNLTEGNILKLSSNKTQQKLKPREALKNTKKLNKLNKSALQTNEEANQKCYVVIKNKKLSSEEILLKIEKDIDERKDLDINLQSIKIESNVNSLISKNERLSPDNRIEEDDLKFIPLGVGIEENHINDVSPAHQTEENVIVKINENYYLLEVENSDGVKIKIPTNDSGTNENTEQENQILEDVLNAIEMWMEDPTNVSHSNLHTQNYGNLQSHT